MLNKQAVRNLGMYMHVFTLAVESAFGIPKKTEHLYSEEVENKLERTGHSLPPLHHFVVISSIIACVV